MGRGEAKQTYQDVTGLGRMAAGQGQALRTGQLVPGYESVMGGLTPQEKGAITTAGMGATAAPFETAQRMAENEAARTRNTAGIAAQEDALARAKGEAMGGTAASIEEDIANQNYKRKMAGLSGLQQIYGTDVGEAESMYGMTPQLLHQMNAPPWWTSALKGVAGPAGMAGGAAMYGL